MDPKNTSSVFQREMKDSVAALRGLERGKHKRGPRLHKKLKEAALNRALQACAAHAKSKRY